jgi:methyl-accepting chemotaxis protein
MNFNSLTVGKRIIIGMGIPVVIMLAIIIATHMSLVSLATKQDAGAARAIDSAFLTNAANMGANSYQIMADAELNRDLKKSKADWEENKQANIKAFDGAEKIADTEAEHGWTKDSRKSYDELDNFFTTKMLPALEASGEISQQIRDLDGQTDEILKRMKGPLVEFEKSVANESKKGDEDFDRAIGFIKLFNFALMGLGLLLTISLGYIITRSVVKVLTQVTDSLSEGSGQVASASGQISSASQSLAEGASEQAASLEETSASLEEISSMTKRNAENALSAKDLSSETKQAAETGSANMQEMNRAMADIQSASGNISKIIKTIDEIAFQTNILALNAAVEAARAGQAGAGFAVVADEVRNLAQRSAQAAKETAEKIEDSIAKSANGVAISGKVTESLTQIVTKARQVDELVAEIATASREQSQGLDQVNTAVTQMDKVTQTNAATAEESASASEELSAQAATLREIVAELQKLVTGSGNVSAQSTTTRREIQHTRPYSPPARRQAPVKSADHHVLNGSRPALVSSNGRNPETEIPLENGFKDF